MSKKYYSKINLFIRSTIFSIYSTIGLLFYSLTVLCMFPFSLEQRYAAVNMFLRFHLNMLKWICHVNYKVEGMENIPARNGIVMSKHQSTWETFFLPLIFPEPAMIAKREIAWIPFFGWAFMLSQPITINRNNRSSAMQQVISQGKQYLEQGRWIVSFPEGTRVAPGHVGKYKLGGARLAAATGYPVVPVAHNAGCFWPRRKFIKRPGTVTVVIGPAIETKDRTAEEILEQAKNWIEETMLRLPS